MSVNFVKYYDIFIDLCKAFDTVFVLGIVETFEYPRVLIDISEVTSLKNYVLDQNLVLGANISLEDAIKIFKEISKTRTEFAYLAEFVKHIELVANLPVRKVSLN